MVLYSKYRADDEIRTCDLVIITDTWYAYYIFTSNKVYTLGFSVIKK
jgi:hypothetical protein